MMRVDEPAPKMQHRVGEFRSRAKDSAIGIRKVDHELSLK